MYTTKLATLPNTDGAAPLTERSVNPMPRINNMDEFLKQPKFSIFSRTLNNGGPKMITDPKKYPYPDYPLRDIEGDKTKIDVHGGFRDYF